MYSIIAFLITLTELAIVVGSALLGSKNMFYTWLVYGSPFYLMMNLLNTESAFLDANPIYLGLLAFHIIKYAIIFRAQLMQDGALRYAAIGFEIIYLCLSAYWIN